MKSGFLKRKKGTIRGPETSCLGCNLCLIGKWQKGCQSPGSLHLMGGCCRAGEQVTMPLVMERATSLGEELYSVCYNPETHQSDQSHTCQRGQVTWERPAYKCFGFFFFSILIRTLLFLLKKLILACSKIFLFKLKSFLDFCRACQSRDALRDAARQVN